MLGWLCLWQSVEGQHRPKAKKTVIDVYVYKSFPATGCSPFEQKATMLSQIT